MTELSATHPKARGIRKSGPGIRPNKKITSLTPLEDAPVLSPEEFNQSKRELAMSLRKSTTDPAPSAFWDVEGSLKTTVIDSSDVMQQLSIAEGGVNYSARRYNDLKVQAAKLTRELKLKLDDLEEQRKSYDRIEALRKAQTEDGQRIAQLQKETQLTEEEIARKIHYTRQLTHVNERLKQNQIKLESHMVGMEDTVKALEKEGLEVRMLRNSLDASLSKAITVLDKTSRQLAIARKEREMLLEQRKGEVKNAIALQEWITRREDAKIALALELRGDLTKEEESFLRDQINEKVEKTKHLQKVTEETQRRLQSMEDAFTLLKQVTAVSSLEEMHEKFSNQRNNKKALEHDVKEAENRLIAVKNAHAIQEERFQDLKSSGGGVNEFSRDAINRLEGVVEVARNNYRTSRATLERLSTVLLALNQGGRGLLQRVQPFLDLADGGVFELTQTDEDLPWADTLDALSSAEQVLAKMLDTLNGDTSITQHNEDDDEMSQVKAEETFETLEDVPPLINNIRVKSNKITHDDGWNGVEDDDTARTVNGFGVPANAPNAPYSHLDIEGINDDQNQGQPGNTLSAAATASIDLTSEALNGFPTRAAVKKNSLMTTLDAHNKAEKEIRRKRLLDRMAGKDGDDLGAGLATIAKVKAQRASAERMSTVRSLSSLPDGVAVSDNVMTKAHAFLNKMPELQ